RLLYRRNPTLAAVICRNSVGERGMNDHGALVRCLGENLHGHFCVMSIKTGVSSLCGPTFEIGQALSSSERLVIFVENFVGRRSPTAGPDLNIIWIFHRRSVLDSQIGQRGWPQVSAMTRPARYTACSSEIVFIDRGDHLDHAARRALHRGVNGKPFPGGIAIR